MIIEYATVADMRAQFDERELVELTDRAVPATGAVDDAVLALALERANAEVHAHVSSRYPAPLAAVPAILKPLALDVARYYLYDRINPPDVVANRFDAARALLRLIQRGEIQLGATAAGDSAAATPVDLPQFAPGEKVFARGAF